MVSDGISEARVDTLKRELWVSDLLTNIKAVRPQRIADIILQEAIDATRTDKKETVTIIKDIQLKETVEITNASLENVNELDNTTTNKEPIKNEGPKVGRNDLCPCGSGKKYKNCCGK